MSKVLLDCSDAKFLAAFQPQPHFTKVRVGAQMSPATMSMPSARPWAAISMATATPLVLDTSLANSWAPRHPTASDCIRLPKPSQVDSCLFVLASSTRGGIPISYRKGQNFWQSSRAVLIFLHLKSFESIFPACQSPRCPRFPDFPPRLRIPTAPFGSAQLGAE